jgi:hypothetical protein
MHSDADTGIVKNERRIVAGKKSFILILHKKATAQDERWL